MARFLSLSALALLIAVAACSSDGSELARDNAGSTGAGVGGNQGIVGGVGGGLAGNLSTGVGGSSQAAGCDGLLIAYVRDFHESHPDMEKFGQTNHAAYTSDKGIVQELLGQDQKPVFAMATNTTTTADNFWQWYNDVPGVNLGFEVPLQFTESPSGSGIWIYESTAFFPADHKGFAEISGYDDAGMGHNFHFTLELHTLFTYEPGQVFEFTGDDDVWAFVNGQRVVDLGGVHETQYAAAKLDGLELVSGNTYPLDFFFAERHVTQSNFKIKTSLAFTDCDIIIK